MTFRFWSIFSALLLTGCISLIFVSVANATDELSATIKGVVHDKSTGETVPYVYVHLEQINRSTTSNRHGEFTIQNIPSGNYTLTLHRIGFSSRSIEVSIENSEEKNIEINLTSRIYGSGEIEVTTERNGLVGSRLENASVKMTGMDLRRNLGSTLSETLSSKPGFEQRTMGAAPARPVIRGLGDERVLILQDGERTGDVSGTSADHAVSIDPIGANEIEIARGPAALAYGGNAIGGVINVVKNQIPTSVPSSLTGSGTLHGSSVNNGLSGAANVNIPVNDFVLTADINGRFGNDYKTPLGRIDNSNYETTNSAVGASYIRPWGYSGLAASTYLSNYGIPPDPEGGHPNGVDIEMRKFQIENKNEFLVRNSFFKLIESKLSYRYYNHKEFETANIIGTEYVTNTANLSLNTRHRDIGFFKNGRVGLWGEVQDYLVIDRANIETISYSGAMYLIQEAEFGRFRLDLGSRLEISHVRPHNERFNQLLGQISRRTFVGLASSASLVYDIGRGWNIGAIGMHSFRPPSSEELFSQGPHIAAYSFEIGNPELDAERGIGSELFVGFSQNSTSFRIAGFHNYFSNYIFPRDTGRESVPFPNLNEFRFEGAEATLYGIEAESEMQFHPRVSARANLSYTFGEREITEREQNDADIQSANSPLPMIPPFQATIGITYSTNRINFGTTIKRSLSQNRVDRLEEPTEAYTLIGVNVQYRFSTSNLLHTLSLNADNILNEEYRNHLSRLKEIFPEPGRNVRLLYRVFF